MFIKRLARDIVMLTSAWLMIAIVRVTGMEMGWLVVGLPSVALLPIFVFAGITRSYRVAVLAICTVQVIAVVPLLCVAWLYWPVAIAQATSSVLGFAALRKRPDDEARVAASVLAAGIVPTFLGIIWLPTTFVLLLGTLVVAGFTWSRTARVRADLSIPRAFVVHAA